MTFSNSIKTVLITKYACFNGRATRSEFWYFALFNFLLYLLVNALVFISFAIKNAPLCCIVNILYAVYGLAVLIPSLAVACRRLHDAGKSGWWLFIGLLPIIGPLVLLFFYVQPSVPEE